MIKTSKHDLAMEVFAANDQIDQLRRERDEAVALLRDVTAIALPYIPKSIKDPRTFKVNVSRAFLSRLDRKAHRCNHPNAGHTFTLDGGCQECARLDGAK